MLYKEYIAKGVGLDLIQFENRKGNGLLVSVGSGLLMATMDEILTLRDAVEIMPNQRNKRLLELFPALCSFYDYVFFHCWFSISTPEFYLSLSKSPSKTVYYKSNKPLNGKEFKTFKEASEFLNNLKSNNSKKISSTINFI